MDIMSRIHPVNAEHPVNPAACVILMIYLKDISTVYYWTNFLLLFVWFFFFGMCIYSLDVFEP